MCSLTCLLVDKCDGVHGAIAVHSSRALASPFRVSAQALWHLDGIHHMHINGSNSILVPFQTPFKRHTCTCTFY